MNLPTPVYHRAIEAKNRKYPAVFLKGFNILSSLFASLLNLYSHTIMNMSANINKPKYAK